MFDNHQPLNVQLLGLGHRYEKAGLIVPEQPIPWNAETVLVDATLRCAFAVPSQSDFFARISGDGQRITPESIRPNGSGSHTASFRLAVPTSTVNVELFFRRRSLGQMTLPVLREEAFFRNLKLTMPTLSVQLGSYSVACETFISSQCQGASASVVVENVTALAPLADMDFRIEFSQEPGDVDQIVPLRLSSSQLLSKQAMTTAILRKPRRIGRWKATWYLDDHALAVQHVQAIAKSRFFKSLHVAETRFILQQIGGGVRVVRHLSDDVGYVRAGPCFVINSREPGMAAVCNVQIRAKVDDAMSSPLLGDQELLLSDGPLPIAPGTLERADLEQLTGFELWINDEEMGLLHKNAAPPAKFTSEGSFAETPDFVWSTTAESILEERLRDLMREK